MTEYELGPLLRDTLKLSLENLWRLGLAMILLTAIPVFGELGLDPSDLRIVALAVAVAALFLQTWLTGALLEAHGYRRGRGGVGTVFGIGIIAGLGILLGLVLLVVPGLILLVRWSMSVPYALAEDAGVTASLQASFEETRGAFWPIFLLLLICYAPIAVAFGASALLETGGITVASSIIVNVLINLGLFAGWHAAIAIYLAKRDETLQELFA